MRWPVGSTQKLIAFLQTKSKGSGKALRRALSSNLCRVNGRVERFGSAFIQKGDVVELASDWDLQSIRSNYSFTTLYEDESLLLVDKPSGWVCDPENCTSMFGQNRFLIHRLDKETTGVLAIAKHMKVKEALIEQFSQRAVLKKYYAVADGVFSVKQGVQDTFLVKKKSYQGQTIYGSARSGQRAITSWSVVKQGTNAALVLCEPITGRTHQIRIHLSEMGHPILVDRQYAERYRSTYFAKRTLLHSFFLQFQLGGKIIEGQAPLPQDMQEAISTLL
jgi:RluA family pseudouridine synthase